LIKFFTTLRELKGLAAQFHSSRLNLSTYTMQGIDWRYGLFSTTAPALF